LKGEEYGDGAGNKRNKQQYDSQGFSHILKGSVKIQQMPGPCSAVPENPTLVEGPGRSYYSRNFEITT
jgi:hypothetical protein